MPPSPSPLHHKLGAAIALAVAVAALYVGAVFGGHWLTHAVPSVAPKLGPLVGYAPPPPAGPGYVSPTGNTTTGSSPMNSWVVGAEPFTAWVPVAAGTGQIAYTVSNPLVVGEDYDFDIACTFESDAGGQNLATDAKCTRRLHGFVTSAGAISTAAGSTSDTQILWDPGASMGDAGCQIYVDAGGSDQLPSVGMTWNTPIAGWSRCEVSREHAVGPTWPALSIDRVTPASFGTTLASQVFLYVQGTHDMQPASATALQLVQGGTTVNLSSVGACNGSSTNCAVGTLAAGTYTGGSYNVVLTTAAGAFTLTSAFTFSSGTINSISPTSGPNVLASPYAVTIATSAGAATGSCSAAIGSTALTGCTPSGGNSIACSVPSGSYTVGSYTVSATCSGSGVLTPLVNGFTFSTTPTLTSTSFPVATARGGATFVFKGVNFAAGMTCNFGATTGVSTTITDSAHASCVVPAGTATGSAINFSVTLAGQTSNTKNFYYYPNSVVELHIPAIAIDTGFPASPGQTASTWVDQAQVGPYNLTQATGGNQLTLTTTWLNSWPAYTNVSGTHYMTSAIPSTAQPTGVNAVADATTATDSFTGFLWSGTTSGGRNDLLNDNASSCGAGKRISFFAGAANTACTTVTFNLNSAHAVGGVYNGSAASASLFYGDRSQIANSNGSSVGADPLVGLTIFMRYDLTSSWPGDLGEIEVLAGVSAATMESDLTTIIQPIEKLNWGTP
ncbi:MAG TPA: IPT/TIG domain-containing protein [Polyangiaceae bacterium]|jgi:hypothetical protein